MAATSQFSLPSDPAHWLSSKDKRWTLENVGPIFSSSIPRLGWDKGRTSTLSNTTFWNFGDVLSVDGLQNGFSMGAAFYAHPENRLCIDTKDITNVADWNFAKPHPSDPEPRGITDFWGMDTSNIAEVIPGVGIGFVWEIWRSTKGDMVDRGSGVIKVTLGEKVPIAERTGPLITGPDGLQVGLLTILNAEGFIYMYSNGPSGEFGSTGIVVGRVRVADAFDHSKYEFRKADGAWVTGIPKASDTSYVDTAVHADGQGSIMWNAYLGKYILFVGAFGWCINFHTSDTPYGPWSKEYKVVDVAGYGINVHPSMSEGNGKVMYVSSGTTDNVITMYKITLL